nr:pyridoxamine 5'-phosphate oxidase family protein [Streptomyces antibioticus]
MRELLAESSCCRLAVVGVDGTPEISLVWVDLEGEYGTGNTAIGRVKGENLRRNPVVPLSLRGGGRRCGCSGVFGGGGYSAVIGSSS